MILPWKANRTTLGGSLGLSTLEPAGGVDRGVVIGVGCGEARGEGEIHVQGEGGRAHTHTYLERENEKRA